MNLSSFFYYSNLILIESCNVSLGTTLQMLLYFDEWLEDLMIMRTINEIFKMA